MNMEDKTKNNKITLHCPYCEKEIFEMNLPYCTACHAKIIYCIHCNNPIPKDSECCPYCGSKLTIV